MNLNIVSEWNEREGVGYKEGRVRREKQTRNLKKKKG